MAPKASEKKGQSRLVSDNRKARFDYEILEVLEAGIVLVGTEVKALRQGRMHLQESYVSAKGGELTLVNAHIPEYTQGNRFNHETRRPRRLLMHKRQIVKWFQGVAREGLTIVPLKLYFNARGRAKLEIALVRGRKHHDKREHLKKKDWDREKARLLRGKG